MACGFTLCSLLFVVRGYTIELKHLTLEGCRPRVGALVLFYYFVYLSVGGLTVVVCGNAI